MATEIQAKFTAPWVSASPSIKMKTPNWISIALVKSKFLLFLNCVLSLHLILLRNRKTQLLLHTTSVHSILIWNSSDTLSNKQLPLLHRLTARVALQRWSGHRPPTSTQNTVQRHSSHQNGQGTQADFNVGLLKLISMPTLPKMHDPI